MIDVGYSGVIGADRISQRPVAVRAHADRGRPASRAARPTRAARSASASRRTAAASRRTSAATRTGPSPTRPTCPGTAVFGWSGKWDSLPAAHVDVDHLRPPLPARARARRPALRRAAARARRSRSPGRPTRSRSTRSTSNTNDAIMPAFLIWGFWLVDARPGRAASSPRSPAGRSSPRSLVAPLWLAYPEG